MALSLSTVYIVFIAYVVGTLLAKVIYRLLFHPLRSVPGPFLAKISGKYASFYDLAGRRCIKLLELHGKYGPIIRFAPDELSFSDPAVIKEIYSQGTPFMKTALYSNFNTGLPNLFDGIDREAHRQRRKLLSHAFAKTTILESEPLVADQLRKFMTWMEKKEGTPVNVLMWFRLLTFDITSSLFMGEEIGGLNSDEKTPEYLTDLDNHGLISALRWQMPYLLPLTSWIPLNSWQHFLKSQDRLYAAGRRAFDKYVARYGRKSKRNDLLKRVLHGDETLAPLTDEEICSEIGSQMIGGSDTTSTTLTYLSWELAKYPEWQRKVREELKQSHVCADCDVLKYGDLEPLQCLDAVITEGLRMHPAALSSLPRVVPKGGATIAGIRVPENTTISMSSYVTHHSADAFPNSFQFDPARWIEPSGGTPAMKDAWIPFSRGSRMCPGIHLAMMELKVILGTLLYGWEISLGERTTEETMSTTDRFALVPKGGFCDLVFTKLK